VGLVDGAGQLCCGDIVISASLFYCASPEEEEGGKRALQCAKAALSGHTLVKSDGANSINKSQVIFDQLQFDFFELGAGYRYSAVASCVSYHSNNTTLILSVARIQTEYKPHTQVQI